MRVLIAEDDPVTRTLLSQKLKSWGYTPVECSNGQEVIELSDSSDFPQICIIDWEMPLKNGLEVCKELSLLDPFIPCQKIMLTARDGKSDILAALQMGVNDYLTKPVDFDQLKVRIKLAEMNLETQKKMISQKVFKFNQISLAQTHQFILNSILDLSSPLSEVIRLSEQISNQSIELDSSSKKTLQMIPEKIFEAKQTLKHMQSIYDSQLEPESPRLINLKGLLRQVTEDHKIALSQNQISLQINCAIDNFVFTKELSLYQAFSHILRNSIEAATQSSQKEVIVESNKKEEFTEIAFINFSDKELNPEESQRAFDPFFSTKANTKNLGLGLNFSQTIIDDLFGSIQIIRQGNRTITLISILSTLENDKLAS